MTAERLTVGEVESEAGWYVVSWNHDDDGRALLTYDVERREDGTRWVAHREAGTHWRIAPAYMATVDRETLLDRDDPELRELLDALDRAAALS